MNKTLEKFSFIKEIDTLFQDLKLKIESEIIEIKKPCLAITFSPDYLGRTEDYWAKLTETIYNETGGNHVIVRLWDPSKEYDLDSYKSAFNYGIGNKKNASEGLFKVRWMQKKIQSKGLIEEDEKSLIENIEKAIKERVRIYKAEKK